MNINTTVTFSDLDNDVDNIYSIMVMSGYLKALRHDGGHVVALPNGEMSKVFGEVVASKISRTYGCRDTLVMVRGLLEAMVDNDIDRLEHSLYRIFVDTLGSIMLDNERVYQTFLTALLMLSSGRYSVTAEFENGNGRYDIMLRSNSPMSPHVLIELKHSTDKACMQADAEKALAQIEDRDYALFYVDLMENTKPYIHKTVSLNALALSEKGMPRKTFAIGRQLMQCCAEDIQFAGLACLYDHPEQICSKRWYRVEADVIERFTSLYGKKGPVLVVKSIRPSSEPEEPVATFY